MRQTALSSCFPGICIPSALIFTVPEERDQFINKQLSGSGSNAAAVLQCNETGAAAHGDAARLAPCTAHHALPTMHCPPCIAHHALPTGRRVLTAPEIHSISANVPGKHPPPRNNGPIYSDRRATGCELQKNQLPSSRDRKNSIAFFFQRSKKGNPFPEALAAVKASTEKPTELALYTDMCPDIVSLHDIFSNKRCLALR